MQGLQGLGAARSALLAVQVEGQAAADLLGGAGRVDAALGLAEAAVAPFHRIARRAPPPHGTASSGTTRPGAAPGTRPSTPASRQGGKRAGPLPPAPGRRGG